MNKINGAIAYHSASQVGDCVSICNCLHNPFQKFESKQNLSVKLFQFTLTYEKFSIIIHMTKRFFIFSLLSKATYNKYRTFVESRDVYYRPILALKSENILFNKFLFNLSSKVCIMLV